MSLNDILSWWLGFLRRGRWREGGRKGGKEGRREEEEGKREGAVKRKDEGEGEERRERAAREKVRKGRLLLKFITIVSILAVGIWLIGMMSGKLQDVM